MRPLFLCTNLAYRAAMGRGTKMPIGRVATIILFALLAGCGDPGGDSGDAAALTADDLKQLDDAAEMLDVSNRPPLPGNSLAQ